jgi:hypothetical protein
MVTTKGEFGKNPTKRLLLTAILSQLSHFMAYLTLAQAYVNEMKLFDNSPIGSQQMPQELFYNPNFACAKLHTHSTASTIKNKHDDSICGVSA